MRTLALLAPLSLATILGSQPAAPITFQFQYAAKVVCGTPRGRAPVTLQAYATSINVNNPSDSITVFLRKRPVITFPPGFQIPQPPLKPMNDSLVGNFALLTDCQDLRRRYNLAQPFFDGFVVIQGTLPLDVTAVYTVPGGIDVVPVGERKIFVGQ